MNIYLTGSLVAIVAWGLTSLCLAYSMPLYGVAALLGIYAAIIGLSFTF